MPYRYDITFTFTKVRGNLFTQKSCTTDITAPHKITEANWNNPGLLSALAQSVYAAKPKWNILNGSIEIKSVKELSTNTSKTDK